jgi:hypothetical protein
MDKVVKRRNSEYYTVQHRQNLLESTWMILAQHYAEFRILALAVIYRVFRAQADWTLTHTSHKDTEQSTIEASITLDGETLTDSLIR